MKKRFLLILLSLLLVISCNFGITAFAYTVKYEKDSGENYFNEGDFGNVYKRWEKASLLESKLEDGPFYMLPGAAVSAVEENVLAFTIFCKDENVLKFKKNGRRKHFSISLLRQSEKNLHYVEDSTYDITYDRITDTLYVRNLQDELYGGANAFAPVLSLESENFKELTDFAFKEITAETASAYGWTEGDYYLRLYWKVDSVTQDYRVFFGYNESWTEYVTKKLFGIKVGEEPVRKSLTYYLLSDVRSYFKVLDNIQNAGKIEEEISINMHDYVYNVLGATEQTFTVEYLENIDKTPFARKVQKQITLKALKNTLTLSAVDVAAALGVTNVNCLLSGCKGFKRDTSEDIFIASYYESIYLNAKTVDGRTMAYFLDPNLSFFDYFNRMDEDDIISQDMMNYCFNETLRAYPELAGYSMQDVYGYFGYMVLPETFSVNQAFATLFGNELEFDGTVNMVAFKDTLTVNAYNKLLKDYNYPWLSRVFNTVTGAFTECNATHVMLYADCSNTKAYESLNGSPEINNGAGLLINRAPELMIDITEDLTKTTNNLVNTLFGKGSGGLPIGIILLIALVLIVIIKIIDKQPRKRRR